MRIAGVATAFPPHYYEQEELLGALKRHLGDRLENVAVMERLHRRLRVDGRYLALPIEAYDRLAAWGQANDAWLRVAVDLGGRAIRDALARAGLLTDDIGTLLFTSVTGIASPSVDARLVNRLGLPKAVRRVPMFGLGCVAGAAGIARAADFVRAYPDETAVIVAVELCSLTWQRDDLSVANIIAAGLFGDGGAAAVISGARARGVGPRIVDAASVFYPDTEDAMGWHISEHGFRLMLSPDVPKIVRTQLGEDVDRLLARHALRRADVHTWLVHPGGPKIIDATAEALGVPATALDVSWECLRRAGNLSSASVLMVLEEVALRRCPPAGTWSVLAAMGPGFCAELVLLQW